MKMTNIKFGKDCENIMNGFCKLSDLKQGEKALVKNTDSTDDIILRLKNIGLIDGTSVRCVHRSPLGDPTAYMIRGALIALRSEDADKVLVEISEKAQ